jgi:hypothetical protein
MNKTTTITKGKKKGKSKAQTASPKVDAGRLADFTAAYEQLESAIGANHRKDRLKNYRYWVNNATRLSDAINGRDVSILTDEAVAWLDLDQVWKGLGSDSRDNVWLYLDHIARLSSLGYGPSSEEDRRLVVGNQPNQAVDGDGGRAERVARTEMIKQATKRLDENIVLLATTDLVSDSIEPKLRNNSDFVRSIAVVKKVASRMPKINDIIGDLTQEEYESLHGAVGLAVRSLIDANAIEPLVVQMCGQIPHIVPPGLAGMFAPSIVGFLDSMFPRQQ